MAAIITTYGFYFAQPWWLLVVVLLAPTVWIARRSLAALGRVRRVLAVVLRCLVIFVLVALLARPVLTQKNRRLTLIAVIDRSQSIPVDLQRATLEYLACALSFKPAGTRLAVVDIAEAASIGKLPSEDTVVHERNPTLIGDQTRLAAGIQMAMAIAPPDGAVRILLLTEGNETSGDLKEAAQRAAANGIPVDVLPLRYKYEREVLFKNLAAPTMARSGQTVALRCILNSISDATGRLLLTLNGRPVDLDPDSPEIAAPVDLKPGTNVKTISVPLEARGMHQFEAVFIPDTPDQDTISENNQATAMTYVAGPGYVLLVDSDGSSGAVLEQALRSSHIDVQYINASDFPNNIALLLDVDAVILVNTDISHFSYQQQEMLTRYVNDLGGGLIMAGGPQSFGAGGWIGSPVAELLPVDLDPPQKKQLPKGALVLIMHSCEMPQGNFWGKQVAIAAVKTLSRLDMAGILAYDWQGTKDWVYPFSQVGDKEKVITAINAMQMGDMPSLHDHLQLAYNELVKCDAAQKHVIVISDGDPQRPSDALLAQCKQAQITCTGVAVFPHSAADTRSLWLMAQATGGRFYDVKNPQQLPQIFIKEAQVVRRTLILEETFSPQVTYGLSEITRGLDLPLPNLDGYVLTGPKAGLAQLILASHEGDPVLAGCQAGLGRCVAFTSSADSRWASKWIEWPGFARFWEQTVRWAAKPAAALSRADCEVFADVQGRNVTVTVEALDSEGRFLQLSGINGQVIAPDASAGELELAQIGPGQYRGQFQAAGSGTYVVNLRYSKFSDRGKTNLTHTTVTIPFAPEFRDLSDNFALLKQVSETTGGRILVSDPNQANLFDTAGVRFPEAQLPLTKHLMLAWLALFLLDVAVRRIAVDIASVAAGVFAGLGNLIRALRKERPVDATLERLRTARQKVREQFSARSTDTLASRRYAGAERYAGDLPLAKTETETGPAAKEPAAGPEKQALEAEPDKSHIQQLLKAKRRSAETRRNGKTQNNK